MEEKRQEYQGWYLLLTCIAKNSIEATDKTTQVKNIQKGFVTKLHGQYE